MTYINQHVSAFLLQPFIETGYRDVAHNLFPLPYQIERGELCQRHSTRWQHIMPTYQAKSMIKGIDVGDYQGHPSWQHVAASGRQFVIIKATEGIGFTVETFAANWAKIKAAGLVRGAYHYAHPNVNSPEAEANHFLEVIQAEGLQAGDLLALDLEMKGTGTSLIAWTLSWLEQVTAAVGFRPFLYSDLAFLAEQGLTNNPSIARYGLWLGEYTSVLPAPPLRWPFIAIWQYSCTGRVPGINGVCTEDLFNGSLDELRQFGKLG
jgi:lysozyme